MSWRNVCSYLQHRFIHDNCRLTSSPMEPTAPAIAWLIILNRSYMIELWMDVGGSYNQFIRFVHGCMPLHMLCIRTIQGSNPSAPTEFPCWPHEPCYLGYQRFFVTFRPQHHNSYNEEHLEHIRIEYRISLEYSSRGYMPTLTIMAVGKCPTLGHTFLDNHYVAWPKMQQKQNKAPITEWLCVVQGYYTSVFPL